MEPNQESAITIHDRNLVVTAGAGSGKTRILVERFVALLAAFPEWPLPSLVAITFTEKAAREMRDRVRQAIEKRASDDALPAPDRQRWLDHQAALDSARIGTIHSLCTSILRANPAEARIDPAFDVLDEAEAAILRADAIQQGLAQFAETEAARLLIDYDVNVVKQVLGTLIAEPAESLPQDIDYLT